MNAPTKPTGNKPIIFAGTSNEKKHGLDLWENMPLEGATLSEKAPQMVGKAHVNGKEYSISVWVTLAKQKEGSTEMIPGYCTVAPRGKNAAGEYIKGNYGFVRAVNMENGAPFPEDRAPYILGDLTIEGEKHTLRGYIAEEGLDFMPHLGFTEEVEANGRKRAAASKKKSQTAS